MDASVRRPAHLGVRPRTLPLNGGGETGLLRVVRWIGIVLRARRNTLASWRQSESQLADMLHEYRPSCGSAVQSGRLYVAESIRCRRANWNVARGNAFHEGARSLSDLKSVFRDIDRIDWRRLVHAYGRAEDVPEMLRNAVSEDADERDRGWDGIWGALNHQGDFYDSTVATIPFFIRFLTCEEVPHREKFLAYLVDRYLDAANYGGDPLLDDPPGGEDVPTPMLTDAPAQDAAEDLEEPDWENIRRMDLCAWQTGRAIRAGLPVYESLLNHSNKEIAGNAANLMLLWHESREAAQVALRAAIDAEKDPGTKAELLLKYGVYGSTRDLAAFRYWTARSEPMIVRTAAAICWARAIEPAPLPEDVHALLDEATTPQSPVFGDLPWLGVYHRGLWTLPSNMAHVLLPLASNQDNELRWRAVQGLMPGRKVERWLRREETCPILVDALTDPQKEVRSAAALALAEIGEEVLRYCPDVIDHLISAVDDEDEGASGHAARLLATLASHLKGNQKAEALKRTKAAAKRFRRSGSYVHFMSMGIQADAFLVNQHNAIRAPAAWTLERLWQAYAFPEKEDNVLKPAEVNRRLADAFKADSKQTTQSAIDVLAEASDRSAVLGAAKWLTARAGCTTGPTGP